MHDAQGEPRAACSSGPVPPAPKGRPPKRTVVGRPRPSTWAGLHGYVDELEWRLAERKARKPKPLMAGTFNQGDEVWARGTVVDSSEHGAVVHFRGQRRMQCRPSDLRASLEDELLNLSDADRFGEQVAGQGLAYPCGCGYPAVWFEGRPMHLLNEELCGTGDHEPSQPPEGYDYPEGVCDVTRTLSACYEAANVEAGGTEYEFLPLPIDAGDELEAAE